MKALIAFYRELQAVGMEIPAAGLIIIIITCVIF